MKKTFGLILLIFSLICLVLGLVFPFMTIAIDVNIGGSGGGGFIGSLFGGAIEDQFNKKMTYSIPEAMKMLFKHEQYFVGVLIGLFALVLPIVKTILTFIMLINKSTRLHSFINFIGKFAMADVFCIGIFIAFLYTKFNEALKADIEKGYYWFAAYVILNIIAVMLLKPNKTNKHEVA